MKKTNVLISSLLDLDYTYGLTAHLHIHVNSVLYTAIQIKLNWIVYFSLNDMQVIAWVTSWCILLPIPQLQKTPLSIPYTMCGQGPGIALERQNMIVTCAPGLSAARYVIIRTGSSDYINFCEVQVFSTSKCIVLSCMAIVWIGLRITGCCVMHGDNCLFISSFETHRMTNSGTDAVYNKK